MAKYKFKLGIFIGRFQPVHYGHLQVMQNALEDCEKLLVFVGSTNKAPTIKNPWSYNERLEQIRVALKDTYREPINQLWTDKPAPTILNRVEFLPLRDYMYNDYKWVSEVVSKATANGATMYDGKTALYGHFKDDSSYYLEMFPMWTLQSQPAFHHGLSSTDVRKALFETKCSTVPTFVTDGTRDLLEEWIVSTASEHLRAEWEYYTNYAKSWASAPYVPTFVTVDTLVIRSGCLLLIKRGFHPGKGLWALPGGFLDTNERVEVGAIRELKEETSITYPKEELFKAIKKVQVFDHPKRSLRGRTITHAHVIDLGVGTLPQVKAKSDAVGAFWVPLADVLKMEGEFFEDHFDIIFNLVSNY